MCVILQLVSSPKPIADHLKRCHPLCEHSIGKENRIETVKLKLTITLEYHTLIFSPREKQK